MIVSNWKTVTWKSPSNIAIVKYWGKHGNQLPNNPSLSLTLSNCFTETSIRFKSSESLHISFSFDGKKNTAFEKRITKFILSIKDEMPFLSTLNLDITSTNSFPHSAGIASSASSMSALALCLCSIEEDINGVKLEPSLFMQKASSLARLASGSASRSVYGGFSQWGKHALYPSFSDEFSTPITEVNEAFDGWYDAVLIVHKGEKNFSSTKGHTLMAENPYSVARYQQANKHLGDLINILKLGKVDDFIQLCEIEALTLHAMMMTSGLGYFEMKPNSLKMMELIRDYRNKTGVKMAFTLDAGPNIHLLYPPDSREKVLSFIKNDLLPYCQDETWIDDGMGKGPENLLY